MEVAMDAQLALATHPAQFLASLKVGESWDPSASEEDLSENVDFDISDSLSLSLPDSFDRDVGAEYLLKVRDALRMQRPEVRAPAAVRTSGTGVEGQLRVELARLRDQLNEKMDSLHGLEISEAAYLELRGRAEASLSLRELALLRLGDVVVPLRRELDQAHLSAEEYRAALQTSSLTVEMQLTEMERQRRGSERALEGLRMDKLSLEATADGLGAQLEREIKLRKTSEEKAALFDEAAAEVSVFTA